MIHIDDNKYINEKLIESVELVFKGKTALIKGNRFVASHNSVVIVMSSGNMHVEKYGKDEEQAYREFYRFVRLADTDDDE